MKARIYRSDQSNANGIKHSKEVLEAAVEKYNSSATTFVTFEEYGSQVYGMAIEIEKVVGTAFLSMDDDGYVWADVELLDIDTDTMKACLEQTSKRIIPNSIATVSEDSDYVTNLSITKLIIPSNIVDTGRRRKMFRVED